ncbi:MAG: aminomethyl-transferring glycine dehydrogenase subunit GcvPB [Planctomycetota bacterium]
MKLIFEKSNPETRGYRFDDSDVPTSADIPGDLRRDEPARLPEVSELTLVRHFTRLSQKNFSVDSNFYPLGSCTMKYNPRFTEDVARLPGFSKLHPLLPQLRGGGVLTQGALEVLYQTEQLLSAITGMERFTMHPLAGSHGELTGAMLIAAYHEDRNNHKSEIIIPDSAHGTNPASATIAGYETVVAPTGNRGVLEPDDVKELIGAQTAGLMLTSPNTLGLLNTNIREIADMVHEADGLMYYDGANLNALIGKLRPAEMGFDIAHLNLHKTFATPHGGGGPGSGPVGVVERLVPYLPVSVVEKRGDGTYSLNYDLPCSVGYVAPFYGNFGIILRAYAYILALGADGLEAVAENAVLNANYLMQQLKEHYEVPFERPCMHEFVLSAAQQADNGVRAVDIAKALIDRGFHPPTMYFPQTVDEALMVEPTETENKETLDAFAAAMREIAELAENRPETLEQTPTNTPVGRLDELEAARNPDLIYEEE